MKSLFCKGAVIYLTLVLVIMFSVTVAIAQEAKVLMYYGSTGNAEGLSEYICRSSPGADSSDSKWSIQKLVYDSDGNVTRIVYAGGSSKPNLVCDNREGYSYDE